MKKGNDRWQGKLKVFDGKVTRDIETKTYQKYLEAIVLAAVDDHLLVEIEENGLRLSPAEREDRIVKAIKIIDAQRRCFEDLERRMLKAIAEAKSKKHSHKKAA